MSFSLFLSFTILLFSLYYLTYSACPPLNTYNGLTIVRNQRAQCTTSRGSICQFRCSEECQGRCILTGSIERQCLPSDEWSGEQPLCIDPSIRCQSQLKPPPKGYFIGECKNIGGFICRVECNNGYFVQGDHEIMCSLTDGRWVGRMPNCVTGARTCPSLDAPVNGRMIGVCQEGARPGSTCTFRCNSGLALAGRQSLECDENGNWNGQPPTCGDATVTCSELDAPDSGRKEGSCSEGSRVGAQCFFYCNSGYQLYGATLLTCQPDGRWNGVPPVCRPSQMLTCPALVPPANGNLQGVCGPQAPIGSNCNFGCVTGYRIAGQLTVVCQNNGQWSGPIPVCLRQAVTCPQVLTPLNSELSGSCNQGSQVGSICVITCRAGFQLIGQNRLECLNSGSWNSPPPTCQAPQNCPALAPPLNGAYSGSCNPGTQYQSCNFQCNSGYSLVGVGTLTCQNNGLWSAQPPICQQVQQPSQNCPSLAPPLNGVYTGVCNPGIPYQACNFQCNSGFRLLGSVTLICQNTGLWSSQPPICQLAQQQAQNCPSLAPPLNGIYTGTCNPGVPYQNCNFQCNPGFSIIGIAILICQNTGLWSSQPPSCQLAQQQVQNCPSLAPPLNGVYTGSCNPGIQYQSCNYQCNQGFILAGVATLLCQATGAWSVQPPTCQPLQQMAQNCPSLTPPLNGVYSGSCSPGILYQTCNFQCNQGFYLVGSPSLVCQNTGAWSSNPPTCQGGASGGCDVPSFPPSVVVVRCSTFPGGRCYFRCRNPFRVRPRRRYYPTASGNEAFGTQYATCGRNGRWIGAQTSCTPLLINPYG